jgi:type III restriction enzyme
VVAEPLIRKTKGICGGKARVAGTRIPVWGLENSRRLGLSAAEILRRYPTVSKAALKAAWEYAEAHQSEINRQIRESQGS